MSVELSLEEKSSGAELGAMNWVGGNHYWVGERGQGEECFQWENNRHKRIKAGRKEQTPRRLAHLELRGLVRRQ